MANRHDPLAEWNINILRNLKFKFKDDFEGVAPGVLLERYYEWQMMGLSDDEEGLIDYLKTGE